MEEIRATGRVPLLVGGTGLYFRALQQGLSSLPSADPALRAQLLEEGLRDGWPTLHRRLAAVDPVAAARIHPNDPQRIQRALEVYRLTGRPLSVQQQEAAPTPLPYQVLKLARAPRERAVLRERIATRFLVMIEQGLEREVRALLARGDLDPALPSLRSVGYRQMIAHLQGATDRDRKSTRLNSSHRYISRMPSSA
jgi:tRNA dimethylallyltransferase